jgi:hypothetical protein
MFPQTKNGTNGKLQLPFVFCKWKKEMAKFRLFAANRNGKRMFVFLGRQTINSQTAIAVSANVLIYGNM